LIKREAPDVADASLDVWAIYIRPDYSRKATLEPILLLPQPFHLFEGLAFCFGYELPHEERGEDAENAIDPL
jgi:hypothetical protein